MKLLTAVLVAAVVAAAAAAAAALPTEDQVTAATAELNDLAQGDRIAQLVRFAFHSTLFGAHGCLDMADPDNAGLGGILAEVNELYDDGPDSYNMSRADFWALAGVVAVRRGVANGRGSITLATRFGREDRPTSCVGAGAFPNAARGFQEVMDVIGARYNMTAREVTVLMGAHSLGDANPNNSGYQGPWATPTDTLDNGFFEEMADETNNWEQIVAPKPAGDPGAPDKRQWSTNGRVGRGELMMLNTDMSLLYEINVTDSSDLSGTCPSNPSGCPRAATASVVDEMVADNDLFLTEFAAVFTKMIEVNMTGSLVDIEGDPDSDRSPAARDAASAVLVAAVALGSLALSL